MSSPNSNHPSNERLISAKEVLERVSFSRTTLDRLVNSNEFPRPIKISEGRNMWAESQIDLYIEQKILESSRSKIDKGEKGASDV